MFLAEEWREARLTVRHRPPQRSRYNPNGKSCTASKNQGGTPPVMHRTDDRQNAMTYASLSRVLTLHVRTWPRTSTVSICVHSVATNLILRVSLFVVSPCSLFRLCELSEDTKHPLWFELPLSVRARTAGAHRLRVLELVESSHKLLVLAHRQYEVKLARALRLRCLRRKPGHTASKCGVGRAAWRQNGADSGRSRDIVGKDQEGVRAWNDA